MRNRDWEQLNSGMRVFTKEGEYISQQGLVVAQQEYSKAELGGVVQ